MRRPLALALAVMFPASWAVASNGCGGDPQPPLEDACGFLGTAGNCVEQFYGSVGAACGAAGKGNAPKGSFATRAKLDICFLDSPFGGQVVFDPPLDPGAFPPDPVGFKIKLFSGDECGSGSYSAGGTSFSIAVDSYPPDGGTGSGGGSASSSSGAMQKPPTSTAGGSLSVTQAEGRGVFDLACGTGETHHFSTFQLTEPACTYGKLMPRAELETSAGGIDKPGYVRFRVYYEPANATATSDAAVVEYFDCTVPPAPELCVDGIQDGAETDIDCGGPLSLCPTRCPASGKCANNSDCGPAAPDAGTGGTCLLNAMHFKTCGGT